jgi:hypothetical protein
MITIHENLAFLDFLIKREKLGWVTTEAGNHILIGTDGEIIGGNTHVIKAINEKRSKDEAEHGGISHDPEDSVHKGLIEAGGKFDGKGKFIFGAAVVLGLLGLAGYAAKGMGKGISMSPEAKKKMVNSVTDNTYSVDAKNGKVQTSPKTGGNGTPPSPAAKAALQENVNEVKAKAKSSHGKKSSSHEKDSNLKKATSRKAH